MTYGEPSAACGVCGAFANGGGWIKVCPKCRDKVKRCDAFEAEIGKEMPPDFKDWWKNNPKDLPEVARRTLANRRELAELAAEDNDRDARLGRMVRAMPGGMALANAGHSWWIMGHPEWAGDTPEQALDAALNGREEEEK